jgi:hypothetical protein
LAHAPPRIRDVSPSAEIPVPLEQAVLQALEKSRENRFANAAAFLQALEDAELAEAGTLDPGPTTLSTPLPRAGRGLGRFLSSGRALALAMAVVAVGSFGVYRLGAPRRTLVSAPARPAPPPPALADRIKKIEAALEEGNTQQARLALEHELSERPRDARVRYMLGRVAFA